MEFLSLLLGLFFFIVIILIMCLLGAWMLRIDEVIKLQKQMLSEIKKINAKNNE